MSLQVCIDHNGGRQSVTLNSRSPKARRKNSSRRKGGSKGDLRNVISRHRLDSFREAGDLRCVLQRGQEEQQDDLLGPQGDIEISETGKQKLMQYLNSSGSTLDASDEVKDVHRDGHGGRDSKGAINKENKSDHKQGCDK